MLFTCLSSCSCVVNGMPMAPSGGDGSLKRKRFCLSQLDLKVNNRYGPKLMEARKLPNTTLAHREKDERNRYEWKARKINIMNNLRLSVQLFRQRVQSTHHLKDGWLMFDCLEKHCLVQGFKSCWGTKPWHYNAGGMIAKALLLACVLGWFIDFKISHKLHHASKILAQIGRHGIVLQGWD